MKRKGSAPRRAVATPEAYAVGIQPSMSRSDILIECSFPFGKEVAYQDASEPARYGSAFHDLQADMIGRYLLGWKTRLLPVSVAKKWGFGDSDKIVEELVPHVRQSYDKLSFWLKGDNPFRIKFLDEMKTLLVEEAVALRPLQNGRHIDKHDDEHRYHGLVEGELAGTLDFAVVPKHRETARLRAPKRKLPVLVLDHKTGDQEDFSRPETKPQLLSLGAAVMRWTGAEEAILAVLHTRRRGLPKVYAEQVTLDELSTHENRLRKGLERIGDGSMKPGPWCKYCPAQEVCPARDGQLLDSAGDMLTSLTAAGGALSLKGLTANDVVTARAGADLSYEKKLGLLYTISKKARLLAGRANDEIKNAILNNPGLMPVTQDNEYLVIREYEKESLSKESVMKAYGKLEGLKMLARLRKAGAITSKPVKQMWPEKERGR